MPANIAVIYYSSTGNVHMLAEAIAEGAAETASEVRLRRTPELASEEAIQQNQLWAKHRDETADKVAEATLEDLEWADGYAFGTPVRFGNPSAQLKQYLDTAGGLWFAGALADKPVHVLHVGSVPGRRPRVDDPGAQQRLLPLGLRPRAARLHRPGRRRGGRQPVRDRVPLGWRPPTEAVLAAARHQGGA